VIDTHLIELLKKSNNLLAFSAGVDSTALFFLLLESSVEFNIAIVDYAMREESRDEVAYAKELAKKYNKKLFMQKAPVFEQNFEKHAREFRYNFFENIITQDGYNTLLTAHQLDDKLEWFLMQLSRGAGLKELVGIREVEDRANFQLVRPLLKYSKDELLEYLNKRDIKYFVDSSNFDTKYRRNYFRKEFSSKFLEQFSDGIKKSFSYMERDLDSLDIPTTPTQKIDELHIYEYNGDINIAIRVIDLDLKQRGFVLSAGSRAEIKLQKELTISHQINISIESDKIWVAPKADVPIAKKYKERYRKAKIPKNMRAYIYSSKPEFDRIEN
jgi:tRNA(Ile)-lysidine synthase